ncbi:MAG: hypothetical protein M3Q71_00240 [Chloroflexota bacterium]|nr:hypothetical protein [Chloroflexota bacterium]
MKSLQLVRGGVCRPDTAEALYDQVIGARPAGQTEPLTLDLSQVSFVPADMLLRLVTVARLWHRWTGHRTALVGMRSDVHQYLERMNLFSTCGEWVEQEHPLDPLGRYGRSRASRTLLEIVPLSADKWQNRRDVTDAVLRAERILTTWFSSNGHGFHHLLTILSEIASNVTHSLDQGFAVIQRYRDPRRSPAGSRVTIAVADLGIGIETSLRRKRARIGLDGPGALQSGSGAILQAFQLGVTGRDTIGGLGLARVQSIIEEWRGSLTIRTHQSAVRFEGDAVYPQDGLAEVSGTQVTITVRGISDDDPPF